ncbi:MAG TPA: PEP/pyruvate-binding domain-containing protein [Phycisphaerae bacterium]|nr:pyruvate, phosphate dikinase [Phycisphaerae bacterium]HOJ55260.1 PEP/pyruvate-binding domain-containing protein [Phycisphaerae bacterium]HOL27889.1 PEP/pyruvate-binding domain-containing protein [Phycisphaerae bacterium]HPP22338.1 PEP/pyruvate-binding domain-containing protein [Phycisphaerae bacterium]HPU34469.1 PEP/pyruvate-binding domain-containing protein [Phycisphaerae bacterium]
MATKWVYSFANGKAEAKGETLSKNVLGGKGIGLMEMTSIGLPVPGGFTITIQACEEYYRLNRKLPAGLQDQVRQAVAKLEKATRKKFGDPKDPLLVSVRSGAARSMPGMLETILNLGLNDVSVEGLAAKTGNPRFAYDAYRRFIQMYATTAMGLSKEPMEHMLHQMKVELGVKTDPEIPAEKLKELCEQFKSFYKEKKGEAFPQDPYTQLWGAIMAVFNSWEAEKAVTYRRVEKITDLKGTAVNVVQMIFGNKGDNSGTGVCFTRDPNSGENTFYGDYLINAQGEDVVAGIRTPLKLATLEEQMPEVYKQLLAVRAILEVYYKEMQDLEFTIEDGKLYMLQCRTGKRSPAAAFSIAVDQATKPLLTKAQASMLVKKGYLPKKYAEAALKPVITKEQAVARITPEDIERLFYPIIDTKKVSMDELKKARLAGGINAVPGAAAGKVVFTAAEAEELAGEGERVILVRKETSPEDVGGMHAAKGILTATGGKTSHAAVVARGWGKCCVVGCEALNINYERKQMSVGDKVIKEGDFITLDGSTGEVYVGDLPLMDPELPPAYYTLMKWVDQLRTIKVRTNADTPYDAANAVKMGAEGIGLCRTEHMFFDTEERRLAIQEMIVAETVDARKAALAKLLPFQRNDFIGIFRAMNGKPVTIRLIDPPLHEFTPKDDAGVRRLSQVTGIAPDKIRHRCEQLHEANPMLGHRGCRLCITYPEILEMQVTAIIEAAIQCTKEKIKVLPEIMIPLTMDKKELKILADQARQVANALIKKAGVKLQYMVGTMVEIPRAALLANEVAEVAEFFSFGTNDLTQMTLGLSRDDAGRFLPVYVMNEKEGGKAIFKADPFQSLDQSGVGMLVEMGIQRGRSTRPDLKVGICGEHGGEAESVKFCVRAGMNYVSCSPYRVPIARLAAAQAAVEAAANGKAKKAAKPAKAAKKGKKGKKGK